MVAKKSKMISVKCWTCGTEGPQVKNDYTCAFYDAIEAAEKVGWYCGSNPPLPAGAPSYCPSCWGKRKAAKADKADKMDKTG